MPFPDVLLRKGCIQTGLRGSDDHLRELRHRGPRAHGRIHLPPATQHLRHTSSSLQAGAGRLEAAVQERPRALHRGGPVCPIGRDRRPYLAHHLCLHRLVAVEPNFSSGVAATLITRAFQAVVVVRGEHILLFLKRDKKRKIICQRKKVFLNHQISLLCPKTLYLKYLSLKKKTNRFLFSRNFIPKIRCSRRRQLSMWKLSDAIPGDTR